MATSVTLLCVQVCVGGRGSSVPDACTPKAPPQALGGVLPGSVGGETKADGAAGSEPPPVRQEGSFSLIHLDPSLVGSAPGRLPLMLSCSVIGCVLTQAPPQPLWFAPGVANVRKLQELPEHLLQAGLWEELRQEVIGKSKMPP